MSLEQQPPCKVAMITNIPAPYRVPIYERLAATPGISLKVVFFAGSEPDRGWDSPRHRYPHVFLKERLYRVGARFIHVNPDVWGELVRFAPDVVITNGFNPTHLLAYAYARWHGARHLAMTDGTPQSEAGLSRLHRGLRRWVYARSQAFVGASRASMALLASYGAPPQALFQSHLCADNARFDAEPEHAKVHDFLFCGRFVDVKNPLFAMDVAQACAQRLGRRVSLAFLGSGELEPRMRAHAASLTDVDVQFLGFAQPDDLPGHYKRSRLFLFPTAWDPWGVVANEAAVSGVPILASPHAGAVGEVIIDGVNGVVLPLDVSRWAQAAAELLSDATLYQRQSQAAREQVKGHTYAAAARGLADAVAWATGSRSAPPTSAVSTGQAPSRPEEGSP